MTLQIDVLVDPAFRGWENQVEDACNAILSQLAVRNAGLTIVLTDDEKLRKYNREFAGEDHSTDVLSFPSGEPDPETDLAYLGDILIAVPTAEKQAVQKGHPLSEELSLLTIHGVLHLLGYDHHTADAKSRMWSQQALALQSLGIKDIGAVNS